MADESVLSCVVVQCSHACNVVNNHDAITQWLSRWGNGNQRGTSDNNRPAGLQLREAWS